MTAPSDDSDVKCWYVIEVRFSANHKPGELYMAVLVSEKDVALTTEGDVCLFRNYLQAEDVIRTYSTTAEPVEYNVDDIACLCDTVECERIISAGVVDLDAVVVDTINTVLDILRSISVDIPASHKRTLFLLADYSTFDRDLSPFFRETGVTKQDAIDAIRWCATEILEHSRIVS